MSAETPRKLQYSFTGKKVLVTGGGRGLGKAIVSRLYEDGASVFVLDKDPELVSQLLQEFPDKSRMRVEVCDISEWKRTQEIVSSFGPLDHLVNCAVVVVASEALEIQEDQWDLNFNVNLKSYMCVSQAVAKGMVAAGKRGTMVNISSIAGHLAAPQQMLYCVAKAGVLMLTKCLATELGQHGIRVNSVSPTAIDTPLFREQVKLSPELKDHPLMQRQKLSGKSILETDDVVNSVCFLLSPLSSLATGRDLALDGGILSC